MPSCLLFLTLYITISHLKNYWQFIQVFTYVTFSTSSILENWYHNKFKTELLLKMFTQENYFGRWVKFLFPNIFLMFTFSSKCSRSNSRQCLKISLQCAPLNMCMYIMLVRQRVSQTDMSLISLMTSMTMMIPGYTNNNLNCYQYALRSDIVKGTHSR